MRQSSRVEANSFRTQINYSSIPHLHVHQRRQLSRQEQAARDMFLILHSIQKRREFLGLEKIQNFNDIAWHRYQWQSKKAMGVPHEQRRVRARSLDPYAEYSRTRLLKDIVNKLKAKNQSSGLMEDMDISSVDRVNRLENILHQGYVSETNISKEPVGKTTTMADLMKNVTKNRLSAQDKKQESSNANVVQGSSFYTSNNGKQQVKKSRHFDIPYTHQRNETGYADYNQFHKNPQINGNPRPVSDPIPPYEYIRQQPERVSYLPPNVGSPYQPNIRQGHNNFYSNLHDVSRAFEDQMKFERVNHIVSPPHFARPPLAFSRSPLPQRYPQYSGGVTRVQESHLSGDRSRQKYETSEIPKATTPKRTNKINIVSQTPFQKTDDGYRNSGQGQRGSYCSHCRRNCACPPA